MAEEKARLERGNGRKRGGKNGVEHIYDLAEDTSRGERVITVTANT